MNAPKKLRHFRAMNMNAYPFSDTLIPVLISWIPASKNFENDIDLDENQGPIERSSQFCDQCQTKELTNFAFDVR